MSKPPKKPKRKPQPPTSMYPASPHVIGMDWIELPVQSPARSARRYVSIGFSPRGSTGSNRAVAIGGTVIVFKRAADKPPPTSTGVLLQMPVDNVQLKHQQLIELGLTPTAMRRQRRGDQAFQWCDGDGHTIRFVGPARQPGDKTLID